MRYRVDNIPKLWHPFWLGYSWAVGTVTWFLLLMLHATCKITVEWSIDLNSRGNAIYSLWHRFWFLWAVSFVRSHHRHAWMQHPAAYMKPVHIGLRLMGIRVLLGSGDEEGRKAASDLVDLLSHGWSTVISPDGPHGPQEILKKGILHIALQSRVQILPVRFIAPRTFVLPSWDRKPIPLPFSKVTVVIGEPITVTEGNFAEAAELLVERMANNDRTGR